MSSSWLRRTCRSFVSLMMHRSSEVGADRRYYGTRPNLRQSGTMSSLLLTSLLFIPAAPPAQMAGVVRGVDGKPIAGATVAVLGSTQTETDADGKYTVSMPIPRGDFLAVRTIIVSAKGFVPFEDTFLRDDLRIAGGATVNRDFTLATGPTITGHVGVPLLIIDKLRNVDPDARVSAL